MPPRRSDCGRDFQSNHHASASACWHDPCSDQPDSRFPSSTRLSQIHPGTPSGHFEIFMNYFVDIFRRSFHFLQCNAPVIGNASSLHEPILRHFPL
jgi:hypothetical protein